MKLIIDIDDEMVCNDIKNKALEPTSETDKVIINALYNGTPVSNEGDLISREALKKAIEGLVVGGAEGLKDYYENGSKSDENSWIGGVYDAWELIDNAPTVNFMISPDYVTELQNLNKELIKQLEEAERPQGEWGKHGECPFCSYVRQWKDDKFCGNCGADMRKGEEE